MWRLVRVQHEKPAGREPDRHVGEEDGAPADRRNQDAPDDRTTCETNTGHRAPDGKRTATRLRLSERVAINASEQAITHAAPTPWATRAAIRNATEFATAHAALAKTNTASPKRKPLRTPILSASEPASRSSDANATVYPSTTHCAIEGEPPRFAPIAPSATFTIVASSVIIKKPAETAANASR
jgi:hypothetical protein